MYVPAEFAENDDQRIRALIEASNFAVLVTTDDDGAPFASHLPLLYDAARGPHGTVWGHLARPNPQNRHLAQGQTALAVFSGPHAYISPSWYDTHPAVPTWNYATVHAYGRARMIEDGAAVKAGLARLVETMERAFPDPWPMDLPAEYEAAMIGGVIAFEIEIDRLEAKSKLSQNRNAADRRNVAARLHETGGDDARALATLMRVHDDPGSTAD